MDTLGPVRVRQSAWDVGRDFVECIGGYVSALGRLKKVLKQGGANVAFNLRRLTLSLTLIRALKTDGNAAIIQEGFCFTVSASCHDVYSSVHV